MNAYPSYSVFANVPQMKEYKKVRFSTRMLLVLLGILVGIVGIVVDKYYGNVSSVIEYKQVLFASIAGASFALVWFTNGGVRVLLYAALMTYCGFSAWEMVSPYAEPFTEALESLISLL